jgi:hypothetical protein
MDRPRTNNRDTIGQSHWLSQKIYKKIPNIMYLRILNQVGCACFENATSNSRLIFLFILVGLNDGDIIDAETIKFQKES